MDSCNLRSMPSSEESPKVLAENCAKLERLESDDISVRADS